MKRFLTIVVLTVGFLTCNTERADAGFFSRIFNRGGCASGNCAPQRSSKATAKAPAFRTECNGNVCRRVLVK